MRTCIAKSAIWCGICRKFENTRAASSVLPSNISTMIWLVCSRMLYFRENVLFIAILCYISNSNAFCMQNCSFVVLQKKSFYSVGPIFFLQVCLVFTLFVDNFADMDSLSLMIYDFFSHFVPLSLLGHL